MKTVLNNLIWLALLAVMVAASVYPAFSGVSQAVIWLLNAVIIVFAPLGIIVAFIEGDKEKLANLAGKKTARSARLLPQSSSQSCSAQSHTLASRSPLSFIRLGLCLCF